MLIWNVINILIIEAYCNRICVRNPVLVPRSSMYLKWVLISQKAAFFIVTAVKTSNLA
jgi:hypothetical protein